jgi:hypothetical protein
MLAEVTLVAYSYAMIKPLMLSRRLRFGKIVQRREKENITGMAGSAQTTRPADIKSQAGLAQVYRNLHRAHPPPGLRVRPP